MKSLKGNYLAMQLSQSSRRELNISVHKENDSKLNYDSEFSDY